MSEVEVSETFVEWLLGIWLSAAIVLWSSIWAYAHGKVSRRELKEMIDAERQQRREILDQLKELATTEQLAAHGQEDLRQMSEVRSWIQSSNEDKDREFARVEGRFARLEDHVATELHRLADGMDDIKKWIIERK